MISVPPESWDQGTDFYLFSQIFIIKVLFLLILFWWWDAIREEPLLSLI